MDTNYFAHQTPQFRVLSDGQIEKIFRAALECLNRTGVNVLNAEAQELLRCHGARVNGVRAHIPPHLIQDAIAATPPTFTLWGRDGRPHIQLVPDRVYFGPGPSCTYFVDPKSGQRRKARRGDPGTVARVCDALEHIDYVMSLGLIDDVAPDRASVYEFAEMVANTSKPVLGWGHSVDNISDIYEIAVAVAGGREALRQCPFFAIFASSQAPLQHTDEDLAKVLWCVERDIPVIYTGGGTAGTTSPISGAGLLTTALASMLSGLTILQLKKRGAAVCCGGIPQAMDLRTCRPSYGGPEMSLYSAAFADICRYLGLPMMGTAGASEAKEIDLQAAIESTFQVIVSSLSGATLVHDVGLLDCADIGSLEMLVMNDEIIAMTRRLMRGIEVSDETLMLELIDRVGPGGEFISAKETAWRCREEIWIPNLMDRNPWESWQAAGRQSMIDRIRKRLAEILRHHRPLPLSTSTRARMEEILRTSETQERC